MTSVYRLCAAADPAGALSGEGARLYGGRWNPPGAAVVYASQSRALAALETFMHLKLEARELSFMMFEIIVPEEAQVERFTGPPRAWRHHRPSSALQEIGRDWLARGTALALAVPSVIVPQEANFLLNLRHPHHRQLRVAQPEPFAFDETPWKS